MLETEKLQNDLNFKFASVGIAVRERKREKGASPLCFGKLQVQHSW